MTFEKANTPTDDERGALGEPSDRIPWETAEGVVTAVDLDGTVHRAHTEPSDAQLQDVEALREAQVKQDRGHTWGAAAVAYMQKLGESEL